jgi:AraC-like DNA-binding protein
VHGWNARRDPKTDRIVHSTSAGFGHALLSPLVAYVFQTLRVSAAVWEHGAEWFPIFSPRTMTSFEYEHGLDAKRHAYNHRRLAEAVRTGRAVLAEHAGFSDLFVPIVRRRRVTAVLVAGPFARAQPTSAEVLSRWRWLTGRHGHIADPQFASYLSATFETLVLEGASLPAFGRLMSCVARLMAGEEPADALANEAEGPAQQLVRVRLPERMWEVVAEMLDPQMLGAWHTAAATAGLSRLGLSRVPDTVLVGLAVSHRRDGDPVDEAIRQNALQQHAVELARTSGDTIAGRVGGHGVVFLSSTVGPAERRRKRLAALVERASASARGFGLSLHVGTVAAPGSMHLLASYRPALGAAEAALVLGRSMVQAEAREPPSDSLWTLRGELGRAVAVRPDVLGARFDRYVEAVVAKSAYAVDASRAHLAAGFERLAGSLVHHGSLDEKSFGLLSEALERAAGEARTLGDLVEAYRRAVRDLSDALRAPVAARRDRALRHATQYIEQHLAEPIRLETVARVAGFARVYFSMLFKAREGITFEVHVRRLRIERAKQLLTNTGLGTARVAEMSGFASPQYFCRVFRAATGVTPGAYRRDPSSTSRAT